MPQHYMFALLFCMFVVYLPLWIGLRYTYETLTKRRMNDDQITYLGLACILVLVIIGSTVAITLSSTP